MIPAQSMAMRGERPTGSSRAGGDIRRPLRLALLGAGRIAEVAHLPALAGRETIAVQAVVDTRPDLEAVARRWEIPEWITDYRTLLERPDIDAVDVCLPPHLHATVAEQFLARGKHVLVEKPLATTLADARRLVAAARASRAVLMVAENWPFASSARRVARLLEEGVLGEIFLLKAHHEGGFYVDRQTDSRTWASRIGEAGGGYLIDAGIHAVSLARHLLGDFASVFAYATPGVPPEALEEDLAVAGRFRAGALASMNFTGRSRHLGERRLGFTLFGSRGVAEFDVWSGHVSWTSGGVRTEIDDERFSRGFREEIDHFLACIADGVEPLTSAEQELGSLATVLAIYRAARAGRPVDPAELLEG